jgi:hypothetical protein
MVSRELISTSVDLGYYILIKEKESGSNPILLNPNMFRRMLQLPEPNKFLDISKVDAFLYV